MDETSSQALKTNKKNIKEMPQTECPNNSSAIRAHTKTI